MILYDIDLIFIYRDVCGSNNQHGPHLPKAVVVDFSGLKLRNAEPWHRKNPTASDHAYNPNTQT